MTLKYFTQDVECLACQETRELLEELAKLTDKIKLEVYDFVEDKAEVDKYKVDKIPAIVMMDEKDYGIRFFGIPSGYEFTSLIEALKLISTGETMLSDEGQEIPGWAWKRSSFAGFCHPHLSLLSIFRGISPSHGLLFAQGEGRYGRIHGISPARGEIRCHGGTQDRLLMRWHFWKGPGPESDADRKN